MGAEAETCKLSGFSMLLLTQACSFNMRRGNRKKPSCGNYVGTAVGTERQTTSWWSAITWMAQQAAVHARGAHAIVDVA